MKAGGKKLKKIKLGKNLPLVITGLVALGLVGAAAYVHFSRPENRQLTTNPSPTGHPGAGTAEVNNTKPGSGGAAEGNDVSSNVSPSNIQTDPQYNSSTLAKPTGSLVNKRSISLSSTDPSKSPDMDSTCNSVAGATCEIHASMGSTTKVVVAATAVDPTTYGIDKQWNAATEGLTPGTWTVTAVAKYNGQTSTSDAVTLVVSP